MTTITVPFNPERELEELRAYLGDAFDEKQLQGHERALMQELDDAPDEDTLYRTSRVYLYDLTVFSMSGTKRPYVDMLTRAVPAGAKLLDYGCGIGADGLALLEAGYDVSFADFDNPSVEYLRWRLERRGLTANIYDLDNDELPTDFALTYSFDVIEHVAEPVAFLERLEGLADRVLVNFLAPEPGETTLHHQLPISALLRRTAARDLIEYQLLHERSHVVLYGSDTVSLPKRLGNLATVRFGRGG